MAVERLPNRIPTADKKKDPMAEDKGEIISKGNVSQGDNSSPEAIALWLQRRQGQIKLGSISPVTNAVRGVINLFKPR